ncbi:helix-turn-helix transcriptional regulator [Ruminococcaceae bacterium OttesenSCG-928-L11]|nr:helix-turn-helix transcriptional regulator [Ruminococcaceae bacterium OttesenSCG-928-L11]
MEKRQTPTLTKWFLSYFLILSLCVATGIGISAYARNTSTKQTKQVYDGLMAQVQIDIDSYVRETHRLFERMAVNESVGRLMELGRQDNPYQSYLAAKSLGLYLGEADFIQDVFIYNANTGKVLSPNGYLQGSDFFDLYYPGWSLTADDFAGEPPANSSWGQPIVHGERGEMLVLFTRAISYRSSGPEPVTACIVLRTSYLERRLSYIRWDEDISILIQDANNDILASSGPYDTGQPEFQQLNPDIQFAEYRFDEGKSAVFIQNSSIVPWRYLSVTPMSVMNRSANGVGLVAIFCLLLCAFVGTCLSYRFSRGNYKPVQEIIHIFADDLKTPPANSEEENEFAWLKKAAKSYMQELENSHNMLENYNQHMRNHLLFRLLETPFDIRRDSKEMQRVKLSFREPYFLVLNFYFGESQALFLSTDLEKGRGALSFAIINVFTEIVNDRFHIEITDMGDRIGVIVNLSENTPESIEMVREAVFQCQENIERYLGAIVQCAMGTAYNGAEGIYLSSNEAKMAGEYISGESNRMVLYEEIKDNIQGYQYPMEMEQRIIGAICAGNREDAVSHARQVFAQNRHIKGEMRKCIILDMLGTIIKSAEQAGLQGILNRLDITSISSGDSEEKLIAAIEETCHAVKDQRPALSQHAGLALSVKQYVEENYALPEMNVSHIGEHFHMTPAYLSGIFREQTGVSLLDFINSTRIENAKKRLLQNENVSEVAQAVGFRNSGAFIRVFKRQEGRTPGQWTDAQAQRPL